MQERIRKAVHLMTNYPDFVQRWLTEAEAALPDDQQRLQARHALEEAYRAACARGPEGDAAWQAALDEVGTVAQYLERTQQKELAFSRKCACGFFAAAAVCLVYLVARIALTSFAPDAAQVYRNPSIVVNSGSGADMGFAVGIGLLCLAVGIYFRRQLAQRKQRGGNAQ